MDCMGGAEESKGKKDLKVQKGEQQGPWWHSVAGEMEWKRFWSCKTQGFLS